MATVVAESGAFHPKPMAHLPAGVLGGSYTASVPLIRPSRLTTKRNGGVGKDLSEGWCLNFGVGCTHGCPFCYVDEIHKRFGRTRYGDAIAERWGDYMLVPSNLGEAIEKTNWSRWKGVEVMMSSTHDPYLPILAPWARKILEVALSAGVEFCLQTRSFLVVKDLDLLAQYPDQVRLQVSIATMNSELARIVEPRVPTPQVRLEVLRKAKASGLDVGVILAPIFPPVRVRPDVEQDIHELADALKAIRPDHVYGESLHARGQNLRMVEEDLEDRIRLTPGFDRGIARTFHGELERVGLKGTWWYEH
jgi:DNA repair photolyase